MVAREGAVVALTIAGSDSGGGAGIQADLKTFDALGVWGTSAITAVTAQNSTGVTECHPIPADVVRAQIDAVAGDMRVAALKTGMLVSRDTVEAVAEAVAARGLGPLVVDPVTEASLGGRLLSGDALGVLVRHLVPLSAVFTPNIPEAEAILGIRIRERDEMPAAARDLAELACGGALLLKGGHLGGGLAPDLLWRDGDGEWLVADRVESPHTHGTGCTLSAAITAYLAHGAPVALACQLAKQFVTGAIKAGQALGYGPGSVNPSWDRPS